MLLVTLAERDEGARRADKSCSDKTFFIFQFLILLFVLSLALTLALSHALYHGAVCLSLIVHTFSIAPNTTSLSRM